MLQQKAVRKLQQKIIEKHIQMMKTNQHKKKKKKNRVLNLKQIAYWKKRKKNHDEWNAETSQMVPPKRRQRHIIGDNENESDEEPAVLVLPAMVRKW